MKKLLLLLALLLGFVTPAHATCGVNSVPAIGVICDISRNPTYSATAIGLVPASAATDIFCISPSTTKGVSIRKIKIGGTAGTAITTPFLIYERSALGTSGTAATGLALPVAVPMNPPDPAATATLTAYTGNPTVAATPLLMDALLVDLPVTNAAGGTVEATSVYGTSVDFFNKGLNLPANTTLQACVNLNGVTVATGVLMINVIWQEY